MELEISLAIMDDKRLKENLLQEIMERRLYLE
nr:MAG TPA: hypothetical protein [Crassvirales sp.]